MRWKLIAGNVIAVLLVGIMTWLIVRGQVADALARDVDPSVERSVGLFDAVRTAESDRFRNAVANATERQDLQAIYGLGTSTEQATAAFAFAQTFSREIGAEFPSRHPREADLVAVTDAEGHVLSRNVDRNLDRNRDLRTEYEAVGYALSGTGHVARDFLKYDQQHWYDVAIAPIVVGGTLRGVILVGYEIADSIAAEDKRALGSEVAYLIRDGNQYSLYSLSFGTQSEKDELLRWANAQGANVVSDRASPVRDVVLNGQTYRVATQTMPGIFRPQNGPAHAGFFVLQNVTAARAPANSTTMPILLLMGLAIALVVVFNILMANWLLSPIEQVEEGLLRIINGDREHRLEMQHEELGGIIYRVNQLVSDLTGAEEETDESGRISRPPPRPAPAASAAAGGPVIDDSTIGSAESAEAQALANEPENDYYDRVRREYLAARRQAGLGDDGMNHEQFVESLRASEQMLAQKHSMTLVRFQVRAQGSQVIFRAVGIR